MIVGGKRYADPNTGYSQTNDMLETVLGMLKYQHVFQSCGPNAAGSCMEAAGHDLRIATPAGYQIPADDLITEWCNNPRNFGRISTLGIDPWKEPNNRHGKIYPAAVAALWGVRAEWIGGFTATLMPQHLRHGRTFQVCLLDPGHWISVVAYDEATGEYIGNDSWHNRPRTPALPPRGFNFRLTANEQRGLAGEAVLYFPPGTNA